MEYVKDLVAEDENNNNSIIQYIIDILKGILKEAQEAKISINVVYKDLNDSLSSLENRPVLLLNTFSSFGRTPKGVRVKSDTITRTFEEIPMIRRIYRITLVLYHSPPKDITTSPFTTDKGKSIKSF
ncbi:hypothetical protein L2E82_50939 [Cichorium intybus]|nr:hypothetical protein L2E82_50939 [Cichorium intybus]